MNKIIIANYREMEPQVISRDGNSFAVKPIIEETDAGKCSASFVEVEPGQFAYGYHYHEVNEEIFYIIRGHAVVRTPEGEKNLKAGDAIAFPASPEGAHVIRNGSATEKLVYLDAGTRLMPDVVHFPDTHTGMVCSASGVHHFRES
ncbi:cupin domain-containing protein [Akkermansia sp.]|uniref:cupin domain-containing protein n=1 Tax=Akkermansia sp. TaxID=1872421 RepID=UPI0025BF9F8B|nr:cupin domain-containing protein [Akkermansia sp.]MCD8063380.1 cupin domain-containing protein [Akkermansia sp.]